MGKANKYLILIGIIRTVSTIFFQFEKADKLSTALYSTAEQWCFNFQYAFPDNIEKTLNSCPNVISQRFIKLVSKKHKPAIEIID